MAEGVWERAAHGYARQERLEHQAVRRALEWAAPAVDERLLDVATGTGLVLRELARRPVRPAHAIGVDASAAMLARVGPLPAGWRTVHADATALPFPDAAFDVAVAAYLLHVLSPADVAAALGELRRVVGPDGRLVVVTVWSARPAARGALGALARAWPQTFLGLRSLDPRPELARAGWVLDRGAALHQGYPSLVLAARRG